MKNVFLFYGERQFLSWHSINYSVYCTPKSVLKLPKNLISSGLSRHQNDSKILSIASKNLSSGVQNLARSLSSVQMWSLNVDSVINGGGLGLPNATESKSYDGSMQFQTCSLSTNFPNFSMPGIRLGPVSSKILKAILKGYSVIP